MTLLRSAARNISILGASQIIMWIAAFAFTIAQARYLGPARFGELSVALSYAAFLGIVIDFGLGTQLSRMVAQGETAHSQALGVTMVIRFVLWLVGLLPLVLATSLLGYDEELREAILLLTVYVLFVGISTTIASYLQGHEAFGLAAVAAVAQRVIALAVGIAMLTLRPDLIAVAFALIAGGLANVVVLLGGLHRYGWGWKRPDARDALLLFRAAIPLGLYWVATTVYWSVDMIILERLAPGDDVGWYAAAYRLFSVATMPASVIAGTVLYPVLARLALGSRDELRAVIEKTLAFLTIAGIAVALVFALFAEPIVALIYPADAYAHAASALRLLAPGLALIYVNWLFASSLLALRQERRLLVIALAAAIFNPVANLIAIPLMRHDGAALTTTLTEALLFVLLLRTMPRDLLRRQSRDVAAKALVAAGCTAILLVPLRDGALLLAAPLALTVFGAATLALQAVSTNDLRALRALARPLRAEDVRS